MTSQTPITEVCFVSTNPGYQGHVNYRALLVPEVTVWCVFSFHFLVQALGIFNLMGNKSQLCFPGPWAERSRNKLRVVAALQKK